MDSCPQVFHSMDAHCGDLGKKAAKVKMLSENIHLCMLIWGLCGRGRRGRGGDAPHFPPRGWWLWRSGPKSRRKSGIFCVTTLAYLNRDPLNCSRY